MSKILLLDVDGVVIKPREKNFTQRLIDDFGVSPEQSQQFYEQGLKPALIGQLDLREVLPTYIKQWNIDMTVDELFQYWWAAEDADNTELNDYVQTLRAQGVKTYLASDQERNRGEYLMKRFELLFDGTFISYQMGCKKSQPEFFQKVVEQLKVDPSQLQYWDDDEKNIEIAHQLGIESLLYQSLHHFKGATNLKETSDRNS
jgi:putative hydrolase of the HAD superfamily